MYIGLFSGATLFSKVNVSTSLELWSIFRLFGSATSGGTPKFIGLFAAGPFHRTSLSSLICVSLPFIPCGQLSCRLLMNWSVEPWLRIVICTFLPEIARFVTFSSQPPGVGVGVGFGVGVGVGVGVNVAVGVGVNVAVGVGVNVAVGVGVNVAVGVGVNVAVAVGVGVKVAVGVGVAVGVVVGVAVGTSQSTKVEPSFTPGAR